MIHILYLAFVLLLLQIYHPPPLFLMLLLFRRVNFVVPHPRSNPAEGNGYEHFECQIHFIMKILEKPH